jgi:hopene-associated glycosyltransferase HpnB
VVVPARNEAATLPLTLPLLLAQDYPGHLRVVVVDDRSNDGTAAAARRATGGRRPGGAGQEQTAADVIPGGPLPDGWVGKVWALEQGVRAALAGRPRPEFLLLTDADIAHAPGSLALLVAESVAEGLDLNSRMARLRCRSWPERLLIPAFLLFFNLLYPMRWANGPGRRIAAAGGCVLLSAAAYEEMGGLEPVRGAIIDDLAVARHVKRALGRQIRIRLSEGTVTSVREYGSVASIWRMVTRSAFVQLRRSWTVVAAATGVMAVVFLAPPAGLVGGAAAAVAGATGWWVPGLLGAAAWAAMAVVARPTARYFGLPAAWGLLLPLAGLLYMAMTVDSAVGHRRLRARGWR